MKSRFRVVAALLVLFAFSASFAEGLWASTCAPMASMDSMDSMEHSEPVMPSADLIGADGQVDSMPMEMPEQGAEDPAPSCPLTPVIGGCAAIFFPAPEAGPGATPPVHTTPVVALDVAPDLLLVSALLRPPQA